MTVQLEGADQLRARFRAVQQSPRGILAKLQIETIKEAKLRVPHKTTNLSRSIVPGILTNTYAFVNVRANYAAYVEYGTRPHIIRPRNKTWLRFPATPADATLSGRVRSGGRAVFAKEVHHPGTRPQPFLIPGARAAIATVGIGSVVEAWNKAA